MTEYPKMIRKKRRRRHRASILQKKDGRCWLCMRLHGDDSWKVTEEHHVFDGSRRQISEAEGLKVYLCLPHHRTGPDAVHRNAEMMRILQAAAQAEYERTHTRDEWMRLMGKNYREE